MSKSVSIIASRFSSNIVDPMVASAIEELTKHGGTHVRTVRVAGSYEIPLAMQTVCAKKDSDAVVVLSYIERGETLHGEVMGNIVQSQIVQLSLKHDTPLGIGIIGPGATLEQAQSRWDSYARAAVNAALALIDDVNI